MRVTFFWVAKRKSPKKRRPPVCDPHAVRGGKPASGRLRGAPWNSLCCCAAPLGQPRRVSSRSTRAPTRMLTPQPPRRRRSQQGWGSRTAKSRTAIQAIALLGRARGASASVPPGPPPYSPRVLPADAAQSAPTPAGLRCLAPRHSNWRCAWPSPHGGVERKSHLALQCRLSPHRGRIFRSFFLQRMGLGHPRLSQAKRSSVLRGVGFVLPLKQHPRLCHNARAAAKARVATACAWATREVPD